MADRRLKLLTVLGARPQFIKAAAVHRRLQQAHADDVDERYLHTGQHYDDAMNEVFFRELDLPVPDVNLGVGSGTPSYQIGAMMQGVETHLLRERPDVVLVYGDTNSTLAGALAASRLGIPVAHVEAGLRSGDRRMQEESNRLLTDHVSSLLFAPTPVAVSNLAREGFDPDDQPARDAGRPRVVLSGDVMLDNTLHYTGRATPPANHGRLPATFALATVHRAEVANDPAALGALFEALRAFCEAVALPLVLPVHPGTRRQLDRLGHASLHPETAGALHLIEPVSYLEMLWLLKRAEYVLTDSGGLQKEACFMGRRCLVLRDVTEWTELVEEGLCVVAGTTTETVLEALSRVGPPSAERARGFFGEGRAAERICDVLAA